MLIIQVITVHKCSQTSQELFKSCFWSHYFTCVGFRCLHKWSMSSCSWAMGAVCNLTMTVNKRKGKKAATAKDTFTRRIKHLCRAYILSVYTVCYKQWMLFPFHVLLADAVECNGGSTELITILNRIGVVCSVHTLKRVIQYVSQERYQTLAVWHSFHHCYGRQCGLSAESCSGVCR